MANSLKLETPTSDDLTHIEDGFRRETSAETGQALAQAQAAGLLITEIPLSQIDDGAMVRDRTELIESEMLELRHSIAANGMRLPVEVFELADPRGDGVQYGLLSGYRRLLATRGLLELTEQDKYKTIRALIRPQKEADAAFVAMVEENEIRANLSPFERGRIAVIAVQHGAFVNVEAAVNRLFATGSKAKRSKTRSFALIFEELGDMLRFPEQLSEKRGLILAQALRQGQESSLRQALADVPPTNADHEWEVLNFVISAHDTSAKDPRRGGRPRVTLPALGWRNAETLTTSAGITIRKQRDSVGFILRLEGPGLDSDLMDSLMLEIRALLEKP